jgi:hypothetical protein
MIKARIPLIIWFYRILGITFGGLSVGSDGELHEKISFKIFGYIYAFVATILSIVGMIFTTNLEGVQNIYDRGFIFVYYLIIFNLMIYLIVAMSNLWFFQHNGLKLLLIIQKYKYNDCSILFNMIWFIHIVVVIFLFIYETILVRKNMNNIMAMIIFKFYFYPMFWSTSMVTWLLSILVKDHLVSQRYLEFLKNLSSIYCCI